MKKALSILLCLALGVAALSGCGRSGGGAPAEGPVPQEAPAPGSGTDPAAEEETRITFQRGGASIDGPGAEAGPDGEVRIAAGGVYRITGASDTARVVVDASDSQDVTLVLAGCDLAWPDDEVLYAKIARSARIVLAEGTENTLTSGTAPADPAAAEEDASGAALRAKCPLTLTGEGALTVYGYINNGIAATGDLTLESGTVSVTAVNDGVKSREALLISGGRLTVDAGQDGLQGDGSLTVTGGELSVRTDGGADAAAMKVSDSSMMGMGGPGGGPRASREASQEAAESEETDGAEAAETAESDRTGESSGEAAGLPSPGLDGWDAENSGSGSRKGLKSDGDILLTGGVIDLDTGDDAIHSGGSVTITGGELTIRAGDDGVHGDEALLLADGSLDILYCYEGLEARSIDITGGFVSIAATDDGMNVNGGGGFGGPSREASQEAEETDLPVLRITGGLVLVDSGGDGLDSNGSICIEGGEIYVSGPSTDWDAAVDYGEGGSAFTITGGTLMAAGYAGMAEAPDAGEDTQGSIYYTQSEYAPDGAAVTLTDSRGNVLLSHEFAHSFNCVVLSAPGIRAGETYTLTMGGTEAVIEMTGASYSNRVRGFGGPGGGSREASAEAGSEADTDTTAGGETAAP